VRSDAAAFFALLSVSIPARRLHGTRHARERAEGQDEGMADGVEEVVGWTGEFFDLL